MYLNEGFKSMEFCDLEERNYSLEKTQQCPTVLAQVSCKQSLKWRLFASVTSWFMLSGQGG